MRNDPFGGSDITQQSSGLMLRDFSSYLGESPMFVATGLSTSSLPRFSTLEIVSLYLLQFYCNFKLAICADLQLYDFLLHFLIFIIFLI